MRLLPVVYTLSPLSASTVSKPIYLKTPQSRAHAAGSLSFGNDPTNTALLDQFQAAVGQAFGAHKKTANPQLQARLSAYQAGVAAISGSLSPAQVDIQLRPVIRAFYAGLVEDGTVSGPFATQTVIDQATDAKLGEERQKILAKAHPFGAPEEA